MQKKKKKSCENVKLLGWPPPQLWKFTTFFFFSNDNLPYLAEPNHSRETVEYDAEAERDLDYDDPVQRYSWQ